MSSNATSPLAYLGVFFALLALTLLTTLAAFVDLSKYVPFPRANDVAALLIAGSKTSLVLLVFMHARRSSWLVVTTIAVALFWLLVLISLTMADFQSRDWLG